MLKERLEITYRELLERIDLTCAFYGGDYSQSAAIDVITDAENWYGTFAKIKLIITDKEKVIYSNVVAAEWLNVTAREYSKEQLHKELNKLHSLINKKFNDDALSKRIKELAKAVPELTLKSDFAGIELIDICLKELIQRIEQHREILKENYVISGEIIEGDLIEVKQ